MRPRIRVAGHHQVTRLISYSRYQIGRTSRVGTPVRGVRACRLGGQPTAIGIETLGPPRIVSVGDRADTPVRPYRSDRVRLIEPGALNHVGWNVRGGGKRGDGQVK